MDSCSQQVPCPVPQPVEAIVVSQPARVTRVSYGEKPNNLLAASVINLLCCFFLLGVIALVFSLQVDSAWASGNYEEAHRNARIARVLNVIGFAIGVFAWSGVIILSVLQAIGTGSTTTTSSRNRF